MKNMNFLKKIKKTVMTALSVCALTCTLAGTALIVGVAETNASAATETSFTRVAHYEFKEATNLGKDSLGKYNLTNKGGVVVDTKNGGVKIGVEPNGVLYATSDFSDSMTGSYSLSMRLYLAGGGGGGNMITSTGYAYSEKFIIQETYGSIRLHFGDGQTKDIIKGLSVTDYAWYRITLIYDESDLSYRTIVTKESDESVTDETTTLTSSVSLKSTDAGVFAIGGRANSSGEIADTASGVNGNTPTISDYRIYSGVIDENEISTIAQYDKDNLENSTEPEDPEDPETENFTRLAHYEFNDKTNLGKDSLGNYDLTNKGGVTVDALNGGVLIGKESDGYLYAPENSDGKDFSDTITGSYSISTRMFLRSNSGGGNYLFSTGIWDNAFYCFWSYAGFRINLKNGQHFDFGKGAFV